MNEKSWEIYSQVIAQEGITLIYSEKASTAYFDINTRTVYVPVFDYGDDDTMQLLVSHEVGHAKYSTYSQEEYDEYTNKYKSLFNIAEDCHIENRIKKEFSGLKSIFSNGYKNLYENNFFEINLDEMNEYTLSSRLNIYAKIGHLIDVPFYTQEENMFAIRIKQLSSKEEVISFCEDVFKYLMENKPKDMKMFSSSSDFKSNENSDSNVGDLESTVEDIDTGDKTGKEEIESIGDNDIESSDSGIDISSRINELNDNVSVTFEKNLIKYGINKNKNNTDDSFCKENRLIINNDMFNYHIPNFYDFYETINATDKYSEKRSTKNIIKLVKNLAKSADTVFKQKKSAQELRNVKNLHVGKVNMKNVSKYKISENIFINKKILPDGKNHGIIIAVDCSGSMYNCNYMKNTMIQACVLGEFCRMNEIPFEIIGFGLTIENINNVKYSYFYANTFYDNVVVIGNSQFFDIGAIMFLVKNNKFIANIGKTKYLINAGATPTVEALIHISKRIDTFYKNGYEKISLFVISDGAHGDTVFIKDTNEKINVGEIKSIVYNNEIYKISDYIKTDNPYNDWVIELLFARLKRKYNIYISFSFITDMNDITKCISKKMYDYYNKPENWSSSKDYIYDNILYLYKHGMFFENVNNIPTQVTDSMISYNFKNNPFLDQFQILDVSRYKESSSAINSENNDDELINYLTKYLNSNNILKSFVNNYISQIA